MSKYNNEDYLFEITEDGKYFAVRDKKTGDIVDYERIQGENEKIINKNSVQAFKEMKEKEEYRKNGQRKNLFAQTNSFYENNVVGRYSPKQLESLMYLVPYMNYNTDEKDNKDDIIRIGNKPAILKQLTKIMKVSINTGTQYMEDFITDNIIEEVDTKGVKGKTYRFKNTAFLRGANDSNEFTKKLAFDKLKTVISKIETEVKKSVTKEKNLAAFAKKKPKFTQLYPLALLGALMSKTHYKTLMFLKNHSDPELVKDGEKVIDILNKTKRFREFKFLKQYELYNMYSGLHIRSLNGNRKAELEACIKILKKLGAIGSWDSNGREIFFMNPLLVYVSPNMKCDEEWKKIIFTFFNITSDDFNKTDEEENE